MISTLLLSLSREIGVAKSNGDVRILIYDLEIAACVHAKCNFGQKHWYYAHDCHGSLRYC